MAASGLGGMTQLLRRQKDWRNFRSLLDLRRLRRCRGRTDCTGRTDRWCLPIRDGYGQLEPGYNRRSSGEQLGGQQRVRAGCA